MPYIIIMEYYNSIIFWIRANPLLCASEAPAFEYSASKVVALE